MKYCLLVFAFFTCCFKLYSQDLSWYFPEYEHYLKPDKNCNQNSVASIWGWQYLKIKVKDSCRTVEVSCYRSKDSTLKDRGIYINTRDTVAQKSVVSQAGADSIRIVHSQKVVFRRTGTWKFYDNRGRILKTIKYKKPDG